MAQRPRERRHKCTALATCARCKRPSAPCVPPTTHNADLSSASTQLPTPPQPRCASISHSIQLKSRSRPGPESNQSRSTDVIATSVRPTHATPRYKRDRRCGKNEAHPKRPQIHQSAANPRPSQVEFSFQRGYIKYNTNTVPLHQREAVDAGAGVSTPTPRVRTTCKHASHSGCTSTNSALTSSSLSSALASEVSNPPCSVCDAFSCAPCSCIGCELLLPPSTALLSAALVSSDEARGRAVHSSVPRVCAIQLSTAPIPDGRSSPRSHAAQSSHPAAGFGLPSPAEGVLGLADDAAVLEARCDDAGFDRQRAHRHASLHTHGGGTNALDMSTARSSSSMLGALDSARGLPEQQLLVVVSAARGFIRLDSDSVDDRRGATSSSSASSASCAAWMLGRLHECCARAGRMGASTISPSACGGDREREDAVRLSRLGRRAAVCLGETGAYGSEEPSPLVLAFLGARPSCWWWSASPQHVDPAVRGLVGVGDDLLGASDAE